MEFNLCYCYNEKCNQIKWEEMGKTGQRQYTVISEAYVPKLGLGIPICPYCKKKMTVTANL